MDTAPDPSANLKALAVAALIAEVNLARVASRAFYTAALGSTLERDAAARLRESVTRLRLRGHGDVADAILNGEDAAMRRAILASPIPA